MNILKVGYREADGIEAKMRRSEGGVEREDVEDEAPTVVVLNKGDLTEEEVTLEHMLCVFYRAPKLLQFNCLALLPKPY